ncbi:sensor histidine kinase [Kribbella italica]|uniref:histidine kinase n=1 Tax=Kribbella italica TaxID=1540520 RepID=A0A7W9MZ82_9ACTN|nr:histidine kinase [Kribbella italica]MBB5840933.1 signal transduction histidine kinase [Kribbella italica]
MPTAPKLSALRTELRTAVSELRHAAPRVVSEFRRAAPRAVAELRSTVPNAVAEVRRAGPNAVAEVRRAGPNAVAELRRAGPRALAELKGTPRAVVVRETLLVLLVAGTGLVPIALGGPDPIRTVVAALAAGVLLLLRFRWPLWALLGTALLCLLPALSPVLSASIIAFTAGRRSRPLWRLWTVVTAATVVTFGTSLWSEGEDPTPGLLALGAVMSALLIGVPALAGVLLGYRRPETRLLRDRNDYLERSRTLVGAQARAVERTRIAGEMHDLLGHRLSLISLHAGALELAVGKDAPQLTAQAELLRTTASTALDELRQILGLLRVSAGPAGDLPDGLGTHTGTRADLAALVEESRRAGVHVELVWNGADLAEADPRTRYAVHRAVREGLTNVHRHAPGAHAVVDVLRIDERIRVTISNGPGAAAQRAVPGTRRGLAGLDERICLLGGSIAAGPTRTGGFALTVDLPVHPAGLLPEPDLPAPGPEPTVIDDAEVLTLPRLLGTGCLALVLAVPVVLALVILVVAFVVR